MISKCKGCGADVKWIKVRGRLHPVNPKALKVFVALRAGESYELRTGYESHFSTCPKADQFRKR
jgi:hypothetical protein